MGNDKHTSFRFPTGNSIHDLFADQVEATPHATALVFHDQEMSYLQLSQKANQLANFLLAKGLTPETKVAICVERSFEMIIGILGIIKAGGAYVPIDPGYPQERMLFMLEDTAAPILLTQKHLESKLPQNTSCSVFNLDEHWPTINNYSTNTPQVDSSTNHLIYTIYTSGSTGKPKGVMIEHRNLINLLQGEINFYDKKIERYLFTYSFSFDGAALLIWGTLLQGATLVLATQDLEKDVHQLATFIQKEQITHILTFPSLYALILDQVNPDLLVKVKSVSVAGETCPGALVQKHYNLFPHTYFLNQYGPTEATVGASIFIAPPDFSNTKVPIGKTIDDVEIYILDENANQLPVGEVGEIYIGGKGVARGYLNRPKLNAQKFLNDPFSDEKNARMYRTGDLGKLLQDGNYDFVGRADEQIKLRGYRIELGEIEATLSTHPCVREAVVNLWGEHAEEKKLIAYFTVQKDTKVSSSQLRNFLSEKLPEYMIPARFIYRSQLPVALSGKIDRKALGAPGKERPSLEQAYVAPQNKLQQQLVRRWEKILQISPIGIHDKFFELGGNSLQAARFISELQADIGETIFIVTIFDYPTIAQYADMLGRDYKNVINVLTGNNETGLDTKSENLPGLTEEQIQDFPKYIPRLSSNPKATTEKNKPAVFILAPPRSGTSLLRVMLAGHPGLFAANELQLLGFDTMQERSVAYQGKFSLWSEGLIRVIMQLKNCDADQAKIIVDEYIQKGYSTQQFYAVIQDWIGDQLLIDKSPSYALDLEVLRKAERDFDQPLYIQLVRHPYSMITSFSKMHMDQVMYLDPHDYDSQELGELIWMKSHENISAFFSEIPDHRCIRIHYEDLVKYPEETMRQLCTQFAWEYHPDLIQPYQGLDKKMTDGIYSNSKPMGDVKLLEHGAIKSHLAEAWKGVLDNNFLSKNTWDLATTLGCSVPFDQKSQLTTALDENPHQIPSNGDHRKAAVVGDIAIVGMSGRFPGANNLKDFWDNIVEGKDVSVEMTAEDLVSEGLDPELLDNPDYVRRGMPLQDADCFDAPFFGYLPKEAALMDPQHRIFLECAYAALEDAGYDPEKYPGLIGVFGGVARNTYLVNNVMTHPNYFKSVDDFMLGITLEKDFPATRVAYKMNLKGPAMNIQTACSSSGVALHMACQSLQAGDADMMLVGGGRIQPPVRSGHLHKEGHALSPDGYCHTFSDNAQGMVRGHGMAFLVLKKLDKAIADGDTIHALIKSTGISNDGSEKIGFTAPSIKGQAQAIINAYQKAKINPATVSYVEAHGTGTPLGDPIEIAALTQAFQTFTDLKGFCGVGSVKTNIGHLDAGACIAGVIKTVLSLKNEILPASLNFNQPNPQIDFSKSPFYVNNQLQKWPRGEKPRRAGVSSLGLGGTNIHIVLEEAPLPAVPTKSKSHQLFLWSAKTEKALDQATLNLAQHLQHHPGLSPDSIAYTLQLGRKVFDYRRFLVNEDLSTTATSLAQKENIFEGVVPGQKQEVVFMFPGGGAQHRNMGRGLYEQQPVFKAAVDQCLSILADQHQLDLREVLYPKDVNINDPIENPLHGISLLFTIEYATAQLWLSLGLQPVALIGHSLGEYTAACISGAMGLEEALGLVATRGKLFTQLPNGGMLSIPLPAEEVAMILNGKHTLDFAAINKPDHCVVSGAVEKIDKAKQILNQKEIHSTRLHISVAAHSSEVEPIIKDFESFLNTISFQKPKIPIVSNVTGNWAKNGEFQSTNYWCDHLRKTVRFSDGVSRILKEPGKILLEVGPGQTLATFARQHPAKQKGQKILASLRHPKEKTPDLAFFLKSAGQLWLNGINLDWQSLYQAQQVQRISLPTYPFERKKYWIEAKKIQSDKTDKFETNANMRNEDNSLPGVGNAKKIDRVQLLTEKLKDLFFQLSGIPQEEMEEQATFLEMGFDSLFLTQAVSKIKKELKAKIGFRQLFDEAPSLNALAKLINEQLPEEAYRAELEELNAPQQSVDHSIDITPPVSLKKPLVKEENKNLPIENITTPFTNSPDIKPVELGAGLESILQYQLRIMEQQLKLLQGANTQSSTPEIKQESIIQNKRVTPPPTSGIIEKTSQTPSATPPRSKQPKGEVEHKAFGPWIPPKKKDGILSSREQKYLDQLIKDYTSKTKGSQQLTDEQRLRMADPRSITGFNKLWKDMIYQIASERSKGAYFWDVDGNKYIDYLMSFGIALMGHTPDFIQIAVKEQLEKGIDLGMLTPLAKEVCDLLCELSGMERATLVNTGSEAVAATVRAARTVTFKDKIAVFEGDYHGIADELLVRPVKRDGESVSMPVAPGIPSSLVSQVIVLNYDDPNVLEIIKANADDLAAVIIEPVQPNFPTRQPKELIHAIRKVTAENDIAMIFDEIITGFRLGVRGAQEWYDVDVDLVAYGKIISGGLPMAAVAGKAKFLAPFDGGLWQFGDESIPTAGVTFFGGTFVKHPLALASSLALLKEIKRQGQAMYDELNAKCARYAERLKKLFLATKVPLKVLSTGSIVAIKTTDENPLSKLFFFYMRLKGIHMLDKAGLISTAHTEEDLDYTYRMIEESIREMQTAGFFQITVAEAKDESIIVYPPHVKTKPLPVSTTEKKKIPLTEGQKEIWVEHRLGKEAAAAYNLAGELRVTGSFSKHHLQKAVQQLVNRHQSLRSHFNEASTTQTILPELNIPVNLVDLSQLNPEDAGRALEALRQEEVDTPFDLFHGPLIRFKVIRKSEMDHRILMTAHHGIADGWSCGILAQELGALYSSLYSGNSANLPPAKSLEEFVTQQQHYLQSEEFEEAEAYWLAQFQDGVPILELPTDRSRPLTKTYHAALDAFLIEEDLLKDLQKIAAKEGTTFFILMYTAFQTFLHRLSGQDDFVLGLVAAAQAIAGNQNLVAHGVNLLPVRARLDKEEPFSQLLKRTRNTVLDAFEQQNYTLGTLVKKLNLPRDASRQPVISILFNMDSDSGNIPFGPAEVSINPIPRNYETFDTFINLKPSESGAVFEWIYNTDLFDAATISMRLQEFKQMLKSIVKDSQQPLWKISILPESERELLSSWRKTESAFPNDQTIPSLVEYQVSQRPNTVAAQCVNDQLSYEELNAKANQLACYLLEQGIAVGDFVGIYFERSLDMLIALLATLKAGGIYVPLDPVNPKERIQLLMEDAEVKILLTHTALAEHLPDYDCPVCYFEEIQAILKKYPSSNIRNRVQPQDLAYVIYTSGSTGKPKSVAIPHYAVVDHHFGMCEAIGFTEKDTILSVASVAFDPSVQDFYLPLFIGAKVVIATKEETRDGSLLKERINKVDATVLQATPASWRMLLMAGWKGKKDLTILCGGEGLTQEFAKKLLERGQRVFNIYGPTETTIWSTVKEVTSDWLEYASYSGYAPVGKPIQNVQIYILDQYFQEVPVGVAGEVYIGGVGVAPGGYFKREKLTQERFILNPFKEDATERLYRTGDMARYLHNGDIEYLSRVDGQVKIRGYRIELGEIESNLAQYHGVRECVVVVKDYDKEDKRLVAYLVMDKEESLDKKELKLYLKNRLPHYMVPSAFVELSAFPLTTTMKVNRKLLPAPDWSKRDTENTFLAPANDTERMLARIWSEVLGIQQIGQQDNFFELGGHSLIAVNMMAKVEAASGIKLPLSCLLEHPTIQSLSRLLSEDEVKPRISSLVPIRKEGTKLPIYLVHGAGLHVLMFQTLAQHMDPEQPIYGLQARGLNGEAEPLDRLEDIAAHYISEILTQNPHGPYALAGYSFGGLIAFEMAKQLKQMGREVVMLGMFDTVVRQSIRGEKESYYKQLATLTKKVAWNISHLTKNPVENFLYKTNTLQVKLKRWASGLRYDAREKIRGDKSANALLIDQKNRKAFDQYKITPYDGEIHLFKAAKRQFWVDDFDYLGWIPYAARGVKVHEVPGDHLYMFNPPHGPIFAKILQNVLDDILTTQD